MELNERTRMADLYASLRQRCSPGFDIAGLCDELRRHYAASTERDQCLSDLSRLVQSLASELKIHNYVPGSTCSRLSDQAYKSANSLTEALNQWELAIGTKRAELHERVEHLWNEAVDALKLCNTCCTWTQLNQWLSQGRTGDNAREHATTNEPPFKTLSGKLERVVTPTITTVTEAIMSKIEVFISHSSSDEKMATHLISLIRSALNLPAESIRCTSVNGHRLPAGTSIQDALRQEIFDSKVLIGLITPSSVASLYVLFELGARWGAQKPMIPLLASGADSHVLKGPLGSINALDCNDEAQLHQFVKDLSDTLSIPLGNAAAYVKCIKDVVGESKRAI